MTPPLVSIIVPAFNVERFIAQCLDSLILQDLKKTEIIIVNDGSTDDTWQVAARYAESHDNVRIINQDNQGLSHARNVGMREARGAYLGFVDSDDWVHSSMYRELLATATRTGADLVITNGRLYNDVTKEVKPIQDSKVWSSFRGKDCSHTLDPRREPDLFMLDTSACKRLYKKSFLDLLDFTFMPGKIFEDVPTHYKLLLNTDAVALLDRPHYFYRTDRPGRITAKTDETLFHVFDVMAEVMRDLKTWQADAVIWANYIWFQSWVLRWLRKQIEAVHGRDFDLRCHGMSSGFSAEALSVFRRKFEDDTRAIEFVNHQASNTLAGCLMQASRTAKQKSGTHHLGNDPVGFFNKDSHTYTPDIWGWVCIQYGIKSVLDIGSGIATNLTWFNEYGFDALGVEGHPRAVRGSLLPGKVVLHDFEMGPWMPCREFDLCLCTEFAEHVEQRYEENWLVAVDCCKHLLLSAAPPGQRGYHHVNEKPDEYWIARLEARGFEHVPRVSQLLRDTCTRKSASWGRNHLLFFQRKAAEGVVEL